MGLKIYINKKTRETIRSLKPQDPNLWDEVLVAPNQKFMESTDSFHGKSRLKNSNKILRERARNYSRDHDIDENIQINKANGLDENVAKNLLNKNGRRRTKMDDI
jgi:hypothetical protein